MFLQSGLKDMYCMLLHLHLQWRWKWVICVSGVHPVENNMPKINQEKICFSILRWLLLPLSGFCINGVILYRKCNYSFYWKRPCHYNHEWFVFFPATIFSSDWGSELQMNREEQEQFSWVHMSHFNDPEMMQATLDVIMNHKRHWFGQRRELQFSKIRFGKLSIVIVKVWPSWRQKTWWLKRFSAIFYVFSTDLLHSGNG